MPNLAFRKFGADSGCHDQPGGATAADAKLGETVAYALRKRGIATMSLLLVVVLAHVGGIPAQASSTGIGVRLASIGAGSVKATVAVGARRGDTCVLRLTHGKRTVPLPAAKPAKGRVAWRWVIRKVSEPRRFVASSTCKSHGKKVVRRQRFVVGKGKRRAGEWVVSGSVNVVRGRAVSKAPSGIQLELPGSKGAVANPGDPGWCTWGAWNEAQWLGTSVSGNAKYWAQKAAANGLSVGTTPVVGAVFVYESGAAGHVGVVSEIHGRQVIIKDMNGGSFARTFEQAGEAKNMGAYGREQWSRYGSWMTVNFGRYAHHSKTVDKYTKFIYKPNEAPNQYEGHIVQWDGDHKEQKTAWLVQQGKRYWIPTSAIFYCLKGNGVAGPSVLPATVLDSYPDQTGQWANCSAAGISIGSGTPPPDDPGAPQPLPPPPTWTEQEGSHGVDTFTNPYNASGKGSRIAPYQSVEVSCKVYAPQIQSANPDGYWYRIASSPWSDKYYAVANTFWNGDVPGQLPYTHDTDFNVPDC